MGDASTIRRVIIAFEDRQKHGPSYHADNDFLAAVEAASGMRFHRFGEALEYARGCRDTWRAAGMAQIPRDHTNPFASRKHQPQPKEETR